MGIFIMRFNNDSIVHNSCKMLSKNKIIYFIKCFKSQTIKQHYNLYYELIKSVNKFKNNNYSNFNQYGSKPPPNFYFSARLKS